MATAAYYQRGESIDYKNETTQVIEAGSILEIGIILGIAGTTINPNEIGSVHVVGVFSMPKDASEITVGAALYYDGTAITITGTTIIGYAISSALAADESVLVKLLG